MTGQLIAAQSYKSYFTGNNADKETQPSGGVCMMGGSSEDDNAMKWFLSRANGGDVLVLRASGSDGYNKYMYSDPNKIARVSLLFQMYDPEKDLLS